MNDRRYWKESVESYKESRWNKEWATLETVSTLVVEGAVLAPCQWSLKETKGANTTNHTGFVCFAFDVISTFCLPHRRESSKNCEANIQPTLPCAGQASKAHIL